MLVNTTQRKFGREISSTKNAIFRAQTTTREMQDLEDGYSPMLVDAQEAPPGLALNILELKELCEIIFSNLLPFPKSLLNIRATSKRYLIIYVILFL